MKRTKQDLVDTVITACEGGVNYWARVLDYDPDKGTATLIDFESEEHKRYQINTSIVRKGLKAMLESDNEYWRKVSVSDILDAEGADIAIQFGLFGDLVYA
jgi:hypothetical protein